MGGARKNTSAGENAGAGQAGEVNALEDTITYCIKQKNITKLCGFQFSEIIFGVPLGWLQVSCFVLRRKTQPRVGMEKLRISRAVTLT